jgi:hypothetical protein
MRFGQFSGLQSNYRWIALEQDPDEKSPMAGRGPVPIGRQNHVTLIVTIAAMAILMGALGVVTTLYLRLLQQTSVKPPAVEHCGHSVAEAKARGCIFDELQPAWMPASCPRVGSDEFVKAGSEWESRNGTSYANWRYFHDREFTREISIDELAEMAQSGSLFLHVASIPL